MFGLGTQELLIIFFIVLLLFGANRIPEIGRAMGRGIRDFKRATRDMEEDFKIDDEKRETSRIPGESGTKASAAQKSKEKTTP
jgi:TatA/E family protein of Tat protein translocase